MLQMDEEFREKSNESIANWVTAFQVFRYRIMVKRREKGYRKFNGREVENILLLDIRSSETSQ